MFICIVSFTDALEKAKRGLYTSDLDDIDSQTTSNKHKKSIAIEKHNKFSKPSGSFNYIYTPEKKTTKYNYKKIIAFKIIYLLYIPNS